LRFSLTHPGFRERLIEEFPLWSLSAVVAHELLRAARKDAAKRVDELIRRVPKIDPTWSDWRVAPEYLAHPGQGQGLERRSIPRHQNDCLIASSAWRAGLPVVTANRTDYERIADFAGHVAGQLFFVRAPA